MLNLQLTAGNIYILENWQKMLPSKRAKWNGLLGKHSKQDQDPKAEFPQERKWIISFLCPSQLPISLFNNWQRSCVVTRWALGSRIAAGVQAAECPGKPWPQETNTSQVEGRAKGRDEADSLRRILVDSEESQDLQSKWSFVKASLRRNTYRRL